MGETADEHPASDPDANLLRSLLPTSIAVAEARGDQPGELFPEERPAIARAVESRRREFITTRGCARTALRSLGHPPVGIARGASGAPIWPVGVVGSLTHCDGYRGAAVGSTDRWSMIGIDAEPHAPLPSDVGNLIVSTAEQIGTRAIASANGVHADRVVFSAKEAVYKAVHPVLRCWVGFDDVAIRLDTGGGFTATPAASLSPLTQIPEQLITGRWAVVDALILTVVLSATPTTDRADKDQLRR